jgi:hypothetical protein
MTLTTVSVAVTVTPVVVKTYVSHVRVSPLTDRGVVLTLKRSTQTAGRDIRNRLRTFPTTRASTSSDPS